MPLWLRRLRFRWQRRIRPLRAARSMRRVLADPDDTAEVFTVLRSLSGNNVAHVMRRVKREPGGAALVRARRDLVPVLSDRERLLALPEESLGHHYARFVLSEQLSAAGLAEASDVRRGEEGYTLADVDPELAAFGARLRDQHDLWHVVTGYGRDVIGELALLAFTYEQTRDRGTGYLIRNARRRLEQGGRHELGALLQEASRRGREAVLLPAADWEALLERPLEEVRRVLGVGAPVAYQEVRSPQGRAAVAAAG